MLSLCSCAVIVSATSNLWLDLQGGFIAFGKELIFSIFSFNGNLFHILHKTKKETNEIQLNPDFPNC